MHVGMSAIVLVYMHVCHLGGFRDPRVQVPESLDPWIPQSGDPGIQGSRDSRVPESTGSLEPGTEVASAHTARKIALKTARKIARKSGAQNYAQKTCAKERGGGSSGIPYRSLTGSLNNP